MLDWIKNAARRNITGSYKFHLKNEPQSVDSATTITVTPFTDKSQSAIVPCHYKWFRIRNGLIEQSYKFRGNSYVCDCSDLGAIIQAEVTSNDMEYSGQANIQFGPVKLATEVKKHIMDTLTNGSTFIKGMICLGDFQEKECQIKIFQDMIKMCHAQSDLNYSFHFSSNQPRIENAPKDPSKVWITFSQNYETNPHMFMRSLFGYQYDQINNLNHQCRMQVRFPSRQIKDMFVMTIKAFYTKKQLKNSIIIHKIEAAQFSEQQVNLIYEIESLRSDLGRLYYSSEQKEKQKQRLSQDVTRLEREMEQIVSVYTRFAQDKMRSNVELSQSYAALSSKRDEVFGRKCQNLQKQNFNLNDRIKMLTAQIDEIRLNSSMAKKNQTVIQGLNSNSNPNFTHITTIRMNSHLGGPNATSYNNILEELSESRVTDFNQSNFKAVHQLNKIKEEKAKLQKKLEQSFRTIDNLQKQLKNNQQQLNRSNVSAIVHFQKPEINTSSYSLATDLQKVKNENNQLVSANQMLKKQNKKLEKQIATGSSRIVIQPPTAQSIAQSQALQNQSIELSKISIRQSKLSAENDGLKRQISVLKQSAVRDQSLLQQNQGLKKEINSLRQSVVSRQTQLVKENESLKNEISTFKVSKAKQSMLSKQNQSMKKQISTLKQSAVSSKQVETLKTEILVLQQTVKNEQLKCEKYQKQKMILQRKVEQLNNQLDMYKRNQEVLNRSQHLSMEMQSYNEQKMKVLKQHNDFLLSQNQKLTKACEKYMTEARQNINLRKQLLIAKQKLGPNLNPERETKSILSGSGLNNENSEYSELITKHL